MTSAPAPALDPGTSAPPAAADSLPPPAAPAWFDPEFYLAQNPDIAAAGLDPYLHFRRTGWREFRNPSATFDLWWYLVWHLESDTGRDPAAHYAEHGLALGLDTCHAPDQRMEVARKTRFNLASLELFQKLDAPAVTFARIASNLARMELWDVADMVAVRACALDPEHAGHQMLLARILFKRGGWRRAVDPLRKAIALDPSHADWFHDLGHACERLAWLDQAEDAYQHALMLAPDQADTLYRLGRVQELRGRPADAAATWAQLEDSDPDVAALGIGIRHQNEYQWGAAESAYRERLAEARHRDHAPLNFAHGFTLERLFHWEDAADAYARAVELDPGQPDWHYRRGCVLERLERHAEAAECHARALQLRESPDGRYRLGTCLHRAGDPGAAAAAWLRSQDEEAASLPPVATDALERRRGELLAALSVSMLDPDLHFELGTVCERLERLEEAATAYRHATQRRNDYREADHYRLGAVLHRLGRTDEACQAFAASRLYRRDFSHVPQPATPDIKLPYAEFLDTLAVDPKIALYESFHGASVSCNPLAVFRAAYGRFAGQGWLHVWVVKPHARIPQELAALPDVVFARHGSELYARYLASAKWLVNNNTFMPYFVRRPEQRYLGTWHGTPLKKLGMHIPGSTFEHKNPTRDLLQATHLAVPNRHTLEAWLDAFHVADLASARVAVTGYPRVDGMLNADAQARAAIRTRLGIAPERPVVLYAPTWRGSLGGAALDAGLVEQALHRMAGHDATILFSGHHLVVRQLGELPHGAVQVPTDMDITEVMAIADVLVTDYSSILFDFLPSRRPLVLHAPDLEEYARERGLYLDMATLPAPLCRTPEELDAALAEALRAAPNNRSPLLDEAIATYCPREDGRATERVMAFFFDDADADVLERPSRKRNLLFHVGNFSPNGVTASFNRLAEALDPERVGISVVVDPWTLESYPQRLQRYGELPGHVRRLGRVSHPVANPEEMWLQQLLMGRHPLNERAQRMLDRYFQREYRRQFGNARFDALVDFSGYGVFWTALLARGRPPGVRAVTYLHSDMQEEVQCRSPQLTRVFEQYARCDVLVSVSEGMNAVNARKLAGYAGDDAARFQYADNCIAPATIRRRADEPLPAGLAEWRRGHVLLGTVGRLSPEKGQHRLVDAFATLRRRFPALKLAIAGEGAERAALVAQIADLGLEDSVRLTGALDNPYPLMRELDLFVLPSLHEGQSIVLLEALTLGTPVLSADIPGPRSILAGGAGILADNSTAGLAEAIGHWLQERPAPPQWDAEAYQRRALEQFHRVVAGIG